MSYKQLYTDDQWTLLENSIAWVYLIVANADGIIDPKEVHAFKEILDSAGKYDMSLVDEVLISIKESGIDIINSANNYSLSAEEGLKSLNSYLKVVSDKDAADFKKFLISSGIYIGASSGKLFHAKVGMEEDKALSKIGRLLNYNLDSIVNSGIADKIFNIIE